MKIYGYYANKMNEEGRRVLTKNYKTIRKHLLQTAEEHAKIAEDVPKKWTNLATHLSVKLHKLSDERKKESSIGLKAALNIS